MILFRVKQTFIKQVELQTDQDQVPETINQVLTLTKQMCVSPSFHQLIFI
jgi:hypothetical protein